MRGLIDDERLNGPHEVHVVVRPERFAVPIAAGDVGGALSAIEAYCQVWGGGTTPLVPLSPDGEVVSEYARVLRGSAVDHVLGLDIFSLSTPAPLRPELPAVGEHWWGLQFAAALLEYRRQDSYATLEVVDLDEQDPWRTVYAACLGLLPEAPTPGLLGAGYLRPDLRFEDFLRVERVQATGSLDDLLSRLSDGGRLSPRQLSMLHLGYGNEGSTSIRSAPEILPNPGFARYDAGPNVVVVCDPGSSEDLALLWNLRAAHGDARVLPIGLPLDALDAAAVWSLVQHPRIARNGMAHRNAYVTSATVGMDAISERLGDLLDGARASVSVEPLSAMLSLGYPGGWHRNDVLVWHNGRTQLAPLPAESHSDVFERGALGDLVSVVYDLGVPASPFPYVDDVRIDPLDGAFAAGHRTSSRLSARSRTQVQQVEWPSTSLIARSIARHRDLDLVESEPGRACRILLSGLEDLSDVSLLAHSPLLALLEQMAARHGFGWYKRRLRQLNVDEDPSAAVPSTTDDLPDKAFHEFKRALGNNERAAKYWLLWAERAGLVIKGVPLKCVLCRAKQWIPIGAFAPPIICRGCGEAMTEPFGDRPTVSFTYRLSERLRRVYEHDAIGHLLVGHYFDSLLTSGKSGRLVGLHPGMEVRPETSDDPVGEADVLMLTRQGAFIPVEVKRRAAAMTAAEIAKLDVLVHALASPWSAVASCEYAATADVDLESLVLRHETDGTYARIALTYDQLLEPLLFWSMGADPFALRTLTPEDIADRERAFVRNLADRSDGEPSSMFEYDMLRRRTSPEATS